MAQQQRTFFQIHRSFMIDNMPMPSHVNDLLFEEGVFTEAMRQEVEAETTDYRKARRIIDFVDRSGSNGFDKFYRVMVKLHFENIADILHPERRGSHWDVGGEGGGKGFVPEQERDNLPNGKPANS